MCYGSACENSSLWNTRYCFHSTYLSQPYFVSNVIYIVGLLNIKNFDFGAEVVEKATALLELKLNDRDPLSVKLLCRYVLYLSLIMHHLLIFILSFLIRFFVELSNANVIQASSLMAMFDTLLSICDEDIDPVVNPQDQTDFYIFSLSSLLFSFLLLLCFFDNM